MKTYDFTFVLDADLDDEQGFADRMFEAGCDDATLVLRRGAWALCFDREAASYKDAVLSAYKDIRTSGTNILRFEPDYLVSQKDIADRAKITRAAVGLFEKGERRDGFPKPYAKIGSPRPLWDWVEVSYWLLQNGKLDESEYRHALVSRLVNYHAQSQRNKLPVTFDLEEQLIAVA